MKYKTRPATKDDLSLIYKITELSMREYFEKTLGPWKEEIQKKVIRQSFDPHVQEIVLYKNHEAGLLAILEIDDHIQLEKIYLLPKYRGIGLGSKIIEDIKQQANIMDKAVKLRVLESNHSAKRFYEKLGFVVIEASKDRYFMEFKSY